MVNINMWSALVGEYIKKPTKRAIKAHFGLAVETMAVIWVIIEPFKNVYSFQPLHLLWVYYFLKTYPTEDQAANFCGVTRKTFRKYLWRVLVVLYQHLDTVSIFWL